MNGFCVRFLLAVALVLTSGSAFALGCTMSSENCDQGEAYTAAVALANSEGSRICKMVGGNSATYTGPRIAQIDTGTLQAGVNCSAGANTSNAGHTYFSASCASRNQSSPPGDAALWYSEPTKCVSGCSISGVGFSQDNGGVKVYGMHSRYYTGSTCMAAGGPEGIGPPNGEEKEQEKNKPKPNECVALGSGQTACAKPNGDQCATASTGKTFCWKPGQQGHQTDGNDGQGKSEKGKPVEPPKTPPGPEKEWQRTEGHQNTTCVNTTCTTYNITNFQGVGGGQSKNSTGDNTPDGSGNTSGNGTPGKGGGGGDKEGEGDSASDSGNCEAAPACVGDTLKCLHLKFTWKIQCNTKGSEVSGGDGCGDADVPVCAGSSCKAEAYAQVLQQWKQRCAFSAVADGMRGRANGINNPDDQGAVDSIWLDGQTGGSGLTLRRDLISVGGGGSLLPDISLEGLKWEVPAGFYDAIAWIKILIIAVCTITAMFVVGRNI